MTSAENSVSKTPDGLTTDMVIARTPMVCL